MQYINYKKKFVMLYTQNRRFVRIKDREAKGQLKIETGSNKGAISLSARNLKYYEGGEYIYKLFLFGRRKEKTIFVSLGIVDVDKNGAGSSYIRFDPQNVGKKGFPLEEYSVVIVAASSAVDPGEALHPVLKGELTCPEKTCRHLSPRCNTYYNTFLLNACRKLEEGAKLWADIFPFEAGETATHWKKIVNLSSLPVISPMAHSQAARGKHYIFGWGEKHYYIGIPGRCIGREQPEAGESGFRIWQEIKGSKSYGYWIMTIDKNDGNIVE